MYSLKQTTLPKNLLKTIHNAKMNNVTSYERRKSEYSWLLQVLQSFLLIQMGEPCSKKLLQCSQEKMGWMYDGKSKREWGEIYVA